MAVPTTIQITPVTLTELTIIVESTNGIGVKTLADCTITSSVITLQLETGSYNLRFYSQGYNVGILENVSGLGNSIELTPTSDYIKTSDGTNNYYVKDSYSRQFGNDLLDILSTKADRTALDGKVSKSGDTMTGDLTLEQSELHTVWTDTDSTVTPSTQISHDVITFRDVNDVGMTYIGFKRNTDGSYLSNLTTRKQNGTGWASFNIGFDANGDSYCDFPTTDKVDSKVYNTTRTLLDNGNLSVAEHSYSLSSYLPNDGKVYEIFLEIRGRTGTASGNYALIYANGGTTACNLVYTTTRSSNFTTFCSYGSVYVSSARNLNIKLTGNAITNTTIAIRGYRRIGTNN